MVPTATPSAHVKPVGIVQGQVALKLEGGVVSNVPEQTDEVGHKEVLGEVESRNIGPFECEHSGIHRDTHRLGILTFGDVVM